MEIVICLHSPFSFHTSHVFTCNFLCGLRYYFPCKETNQIIISFEFGLWWNPADSVSCMLLRHIRQLISSWLYVVSPSCEQFTMRSHTSVQGTWLTCHFWSHDLEALLYWSIQQYSAISLIHYHNNFFFAQELFASHKGVFIRPV